MPVMVVVVGAVMGESSPVGVGQVGKRDRFGRRAEDPADGVSAPPVE